jgi:hypothetical protein
MFVAILARKAENGFTIERTAMGRALDKNPCHHLSDVPFISQGKTSADETNE